MRPTLSLISREFSAYFYSPIAYVVLAGFLAVTGHLFYITLEQLTETGPRGRSASHAWRITSVGLVAIVASVAVAATRLAQPAGGEGTDPAAVALLLARDL